MGSICAFGEVMLRLATPLGQGLQQLPALTPTFGGSEANVAAALAQLGHRAELVTVLPDNAMGEACRTHFQTLGVGVDGCQRAAGRMGIYFLERGVGSHPSQVLYDRADSTFARASLDALDWPSLLNRCNALHLSGITLALSQAAGAAAVNAARAAKDQGCRVSFDCNYRGSLWDSEQAARQAYLEILPLVDYLFASPRDAGLVFDRPIPEANALKQGQWTFQSFRKIAPGLQWLACTQRQHLDGKAALGAMVIDDNSAVGLEPEPLKRVVDRVGSGDAFAAGQLHGVLSQWPMRESLQFALKAAQTKHAIEGDQLRAGETDLAPALEGNVDIQR